MPNCRNRYYILLHILLLCWWAGKCRLKIQSLKLGDIHSLCKWRKIIELMLYKTCQIYLGQFMLLNTTRFLNPDDALPETTIKIPTTRANLVSFTSDRVKVNINMNTTSVHREHVKHGFDWVWNQGSSSCYFSGYYISGYRRAGWCPIVHFKANIVWYR